MPLSSIHTRPREFRAAIEYTSAQSGFIARLIEKDYWCSMLLHAMFENGDTPLVFKGGTLLSKSYADFQRLSEDLDFTVASEDLGSRSERRRISKEIEADLIRVTERLGLGWKEAWRGHNQSTQYTGRISYPSILGVQDSVLVEVGMREVPVENPVWVKLKTMLRNPLFGEPEVDEILVRGYTLKEAYAEKVRAALTRKDPAIRDIYDLWRAHTLGILPLESRDWLNLIKQKCEKYDLTAACCEQRKVQFSSRVKTDLHPVLRSELAMSFDFIEGWNLLVDILQKVS